MSKDAVYKSQFVRFDGSQVVPMMTFKSKQGQSNYLKSLVASLGNVMGKIKCQRLQIGCTF